MSRDKVTIFKQYPLKEGQKIRLIGGKRGGDWLVIGVDEKKARLKCPISGVEVEWDRFFSFTEELEDEEWPLKE